MDLQTRISSCLVITCRILRFFFVATFVASILWVNSKIQVFRWALPRRDLRSDKKEFRFTFSENSKLWGLEGSYPEEMGISFQNQLDSTGQLAFAYTTHDTCSVSTGESCCIENSNSTLSNQVYHG